MLMLLIGDKIQVRDRKEVDSKARHVVLTAFRDADNGDAFGEALRAYRAKYPNIDIETARHAVAYVLSTDGL